MRSRLLVAVVAVAVVAAACSSPSKPTAQAPTTTAARAQAPAITRETQIESAVQQHRLTPQLAEMQFALDVGPLPGVSVKGITTDSANFDATPAVMDLDAEWSHLSTAQQHAADADLTSTTELKSTGATTTTTASARTGPAPGYVLTALTDVPSVDYLSLAEQANVEEATALGVAGIPGLVIDDKPGLLTPHSEPYASTSYYEWSYLHDRWQPFADGCHITIFEAEWAGLDATDAAAIMAHEVFHCFQQRAAGTNQNAVSVSAWVSEGEATWVMAQLYPTATVVGPKWTTYTNTPLTTFSDRSYDGIGIFGHEGDVAGGQASVWPQLLPTVTADIKHNDSSALATLVSGGSNRFYSAWGPSYFLDPAGPDWHMGGPGPVSSSAPTPTSVTIGNDDGQDIGLLPPYQASQVTIQGDADILVVTLTSGYGELHDQGYTVSRTLDANSGTPVRLCLKTGGCTCPDGSPGASTFTTQATGPISVGLDGGDHSLAAYAAGTSLDKFCKKPDLPPPTGGTPPPPGGGGGGGGSDPDPDPAHPGGTSAGDPHLSTYDGRFYDLQAAGELVLTRSTTDDFEVQVRSEPVVGSSAVAVNEAVAMRLDGHRVVLSEQNGAIGAGLDGTPLIDQVTRVGNGTVSRLGTDAGEPWVVEWPDGTTVEATPYGTTGLNVSVRPAADRAGKLVGLLGNDDGNPADDLALADGTQLGSPVSDATLDTTYANSWRITQADSLFDYAAGQTTATFTDPTFPQSQVGAATAPNRAQITKECQAEGITDPYLLQACVVDASEGGGQAALSQYAQAQVVHTVDFDLAHHVKPFTSSSTTPTTVAGSAPTQTTLSGTALRTLVDTGVIASPKEDKTFSFPAKSGDVIWIGDPGCDDDGMTFILKDPSGKVLDPDDLGSGGLGGCLDGRFVLKASGTYQLVANANHSRQGSYGVPIRFERPDVVRHTSYGQTLSGTIPMTAAHDVYTFQARAGDIVRINGPGCSLGFAHPQTVGQQDNVNIMSTSGQSVVLLGCEGGLTIAIPTTGTYEAVVNFANTGPLHYHFVLQK